MNVIGKRWQGGFTLTRVSQDKKVHLAQMGSDAAISASASCRSKWF